MGYSRIYNYSSPLQELELLFWWHVHISQLSKGQVKKHRNKQDSVSSEETVTLNSTREYVLSVFNE